MSLETGLDQRFFAVHEPDTPTLMRMRRFYSVANLYAALYFDFEKRPDVEMYEYSFARVNDKGQVYPSKEIVNRQYVLGVYLVRRALYEELKGLGVKDLMDAAIAEMSERYKITR